MAYAYDRRDPTKVTYPTGNAVSSNFDAAGRLEFVDDWRDNPSVSADEEVGQPPR